MEEDILTKVTQLPQSQSGLFKSKVINVEVLRYQEEDKPTTVGSFEVDLKFLAEEPGK